MKTLIPALLIALLPACRQQEEPVPEPGIQSYETLVVDGRERRYILYLPAGTEQATALPLVFVLHGGNVGTPENMMANADFRPLADRDKFVLVYPAGVKNNWNDGRPTDANLLGVDDVNFFRVLIDTLAGRYPINLGAVFVTGISNGGFMASRLGCELSDKITAFASVAATIEEFTSNNCNPPGYVSALYMHGTADTFVPFEGGEMTVGDGGTVVSHFEAISIWNANNRLQTFDPEITEFPDIADDGTTVVRRQYIGRYNGYEVTSYVIYNGGHTWPGGKGPHFPKLVGNRSYDIDATEEIWAFFQRRINK